MIFYLGEQIKHSQRGELGALFLYKSGNYKILSAPLISKLFTDMTANLKTYESAKRTYLGISENAIKSAEILLKKITQNNILKSIDELLVLPEFINDELIFENIRNSPTNTDETTPSAQMIPPSVLYEARQPKRV